MLNGFPFYGFFHVQGYGSGRVTWCQMQLHESPALLTDAIPMCSLPDAVYSFQVCNILSSSKSEHVILSASSAGGAFTELGSGVCVLDRTGATSPPKLICTPMNHNRAPNQRCPVLMVAFTGSLMCSDLFGSPVLPILGPASSVLPASTVTAAATTVQACWLPTFDRQEHNLLIALSSETHVFLYIVAAVTLLSGGRGGMLASTSTCEVLSSLDEASLLADITESQRYVLFASIDQFLYLT